MRSLLVAATALLTLAVPAHAGFPYCTVLTDPAGDVRLEPAASTAGHVPDGHVDLRSIEVVGAHRTVIVTFHAGALDRRRGSLWQVGFAFGRRQVVVEAEVPALGSPEFRAGRADGGLETVSGEVHSDTSTVVGVALAEAFGTALPARGTAFSGFVARASAVVAREDGLTQQPGTAGLVDDGASSATYRFGRTCR